MHFVDNMPPAFDPEAVLAKMFAPNDFLPPCKDQVYVSAHSCSGVIEGVFTYKDSNALACPVFLLGLPGDPNKFLPEQDKWICRKAEKLLPNVWC